MSKSKSEKLLDLFKAEKIPTADEFKDLVVALDNHQLLAKVFLLEGTPFVFRDSPMKYTVFREQVGDQFDVGSQDVCIVGSAKLGFSPSPSTKEDGKPKYGTPFSETSDVDVVVVSPRLFDIGQRKLFSSLSRLGPPLHLVRPFARGKGKGAKPIVDLRDWQSFKEAVRNFTFENFNPGLLPNDDPLKQEIFSKISSTAGIFCALEPRVFVSKIRTRIFYSWKSAESYYANSLRDLKDALGGNKEIEPTEEEDEEVVAGFVEESKKE